MAARKKAPASASVDSKAAPGTLENGKSDLENYADDVTSDAYKDAIKLYPLIAQGYRNQDERANEIESCWNIFNCIPDSNAGYSGNSACYVPAVRDALMARAKRIVKQLFAASHRHVDAITADKDTPFTALSLIEHNIRETELKDICRTGIVAGDVTGQWNFYMDWTKSYRRVTGIQLKEPPITHIDGEDVVDLNLRDEDAEPEEELDTEDICEEGPDVVAFADEDLLVIPPTAKSIQKAKAAIMALRMSEDKVQELVDEGVFLLPDDCKDAEELFDRLEQKAKGKQKKNPDKKATNDAGIKTHGTDKHALIYECFTKLKIEGIKQEAIVYFAGEDDILGIIKLPYWAGKRPIISAPVDKLSGSFKGRSKIEPVKYMQWNLNDYWNMGQDSAAYSLMPVFAADPSKNPNWASMVLGLAAVWPIGPNDIKQFEFAQLYKESMALCQGIKSQIWESLDVNETMMGKMPQGRKNNQLLGAMQQEQMINIIDVAERFETQILNPIVEWFHELDVQFRTKSVTIQARGEIGVKASMMVAEPQQWGERYHFQWYGTKAIAGAQLMQQQVSILNVVKGIPPALTPGRRLNLVPAIEKLLSDSFGPDVASKIFEDISDMFTIDPEIENEMLHNQLEVQVHESDNDAEHLQAHMKGAAVAGDPAMFFKKHMAAHMQQMQKKRQMAMSQQAQGSPGGPGGGGQPGVAGTPGAQVQGPRGGPQQPPGAVHPDLMVDGNAAGRG